MNKRRKIKLRNRRITIDMRLNAMIEQFNQLPVEEKKTTGYAQKIEHWSWWGVPGCYSDRATIPKWFDSKVFEEIVRAGAVECMVSASEYVREAKKWQINRQQGVAVSQEQVNHYDGRRNQNPY